MTVSPAMSIINPESVLQSLTLDDKIRLLSGDDMWHTAPVPEAGVPRVRMCDGPNGVRGTAWINAHPASCFPCGLGLGASFDLDLAHRVGVALGKECRARGTHCLLGPTIGIPRNPLGGRGFESFSEDPLHTGLTARAWIDGVQSQRVMTSPKHFVCNEQEAFRRSTNSVVDERTLHEIYLEPFRIICQSEPATMMTAYNQVNGLHASEHPELLRNILRKDFGFEGMIMSDWGGTYSCKESIEASLDLEMPGPSMMRGAMIERYVLSGKLTVNDVDDCVLRVLRFVQQAQQSSIPFEAEEGTVDSPELRALLRESASAGVVLLKNDSNVLPLAAKSGLRVAVIGQNANIACHAGGGSAHVIPTYAISPLKAIQKVVEAAGGTVEHALGSAGHRWQPELTPYIEAGGINGMLVEFSDVCLWRESVKPLHSMYIAGSKPFFVDGIPKTIPTRGYIQLTTTFTPHVGGLWDFGLAVAGQAQLYLDDQLVIDHTKDQQPSVLFFNTGSEERIGTALVEAGRSYRIQVRFSNFEQIDSMSPYAGRRGGVRLGGQPQVSPQELRSEAVELSARSDVTILVVGTNAEWESESYDRDDMCLPPGSDELVRAVLQAQPRTIVVNQSGMPVELPWIDQAPAVVQAFFGGNECGTGIADVLFGVAEPRGRLPITWPVNYEQVRGQETFGGAQPTVYAEGLQVGYRRQDAPLFAFGHGLSYTQFSYSERSLHYDSEHHVLVSFTVKNTGERVGVAIPQIYVVSPMGEIKLGGFSSRSVEPGQEVELSVQLTHESFSVYDATTSRWVIFNGVYEIRLGESAGSHILFGRHEIKETWCWKGQLQPVIL